MNPGTVCIDARKLDDFGIGTYIRGLVTALLDLDDSSYDLIVRCDHGLPPRLSAARDEGRVRIEVVDAPGYSLKEQILVPRALSRLQPAVFHSPHYVLPLRLRLPTVVTVHDVIHLLNPEALPNPLAATFARVMIGRALRRAEAITVSQSSRKDIEKLFGPQPRLHVIPPGIEDRFTPACDRSEDAEILNRLGLTPGYTLWVGNPKPHKNLPRVLAAWDRVESDRPLVLVGPGPADLSQASSDPQPSSHPRSAPRARRVVALGRLADGDLPAVYRNAVALVMVSLFEGFGLPVAEAMASGTPVLTSDRSSLAEVVGESGLKVDPYDVEAIAAGLQRLVTEPALRSELATAGLERAKGFAWPATARATRQIYDRLLVRA